VSRGSGRRVGRGDRAPRELGASLREVRAAAAPETLLAAVQAGWAGTVGDRVASEAHPVSERGRVVRVACRSATWAHELDLLQRTLLERLNALSDVAARGPLAGLRFTADATRHDDALS
jgi:predicted nucleic acid-binding Zn ribbon protein